LEAVDFLIKNNVGKAQQEAMVQIMNELSSIRENMDEIERDFQRRKLQKDAKINRLQSQLKLISMQKSTNTID